MRQKPIYVEIEMTSDLDKLWEYTQNPSLHKEWDLRFTNIHTCISSRSFFMRRG